MFFFSFSFSLSVILKFVCPIICTLTSDPTVVVVGAWNAFYLLGLVGEQ